jgi:hypothetical protein
MIWVILSLLIIVGLLSAIFLAGGWSAILMVVVAFGIIGGTIGIIIVFCKALDYLDGK